MSIFFQNIERAVFERYRVMRGAVSRRMRNWNFDGALVLDKSAFWESHFFPLGSERAISGAGDKQWKTKSNDEQR